jgi:hypothetical protein
MKSAALAFNCFARYLTLRASPNAVETVSRAQSGHAGADFAKGTIDPKRTQRVMTNALRYLFGMWRY